MANQDLINAVNLLLSEGNQPEDVKEFLVNQGWQEQAVAEVLASIKKPPTFWEQLPTYPYFQALDQKTANLPPKMIWMIAGLMIAIVFIFGFLIYFYMNPYVAGGEERDREREIVYKQLQTAINRFHATNNRYPVSLNELTPVYIKFVPRDPKSSKPYNYNTRNQGEAYSLCIIYETKSVTEGCVNSEIFDTDKLNIPTDSEPAPGNMFNGLL